MRQLTAFSTSAVLGLSLMTACGGKIKPKGPVLTPYERARDFAKTDYSPAKYASGLPAFTDAPVLPFMAFGMPFDIDVAIGLKDDRWDMVEFARMQTQDGPQWLVLESRAGTKDQVLVSNHPDVNVMLPELPLERKLSNLVVTDRTTSDGLDIEVRYDNSDNEPVTAVLQGDPPTKYLKKRNGNTMGHSASSLMAVLDVSSGESLFKGEVRINDRRVPNAKVAGFVPMRFTLTQAQGGIAAGTYQQVPTQMVPFENGAEIMAAQKWEPPAPPPPPPAIPAPMNVPTEEDGIVLLDIAEWKRLEGKDLELAWSNQTAKPESCLLGATAIDPNYKGLAVVDLYAKMGEPWQVTVDPMSTANELVMNCVAEMVSGYTFDEKLDGSMHIEVGLFPEGHEPVNELETKYFAAQAKAAEEAAKNAPVKGKGTTKPAPTPPPEPAPVDDLLEGDPDAPPAEPEPTGASPLANFDTIHSMANGDKVVQGWTVERSGGRVFVKQDSGVRELVYEFLVHGEDSVLELRSIRVEAWGQAVPAFNMTFSPALPDMRRAFGGRVTSKFVMDVNGQQSYATGEVIATFGDAGGKLEIKPSDPAWVEDRPMISTINFKDRMPYVTTRRAE